MRNPFKSKAFFVYRAICLIAVLYALAAIIAAFFSADEEAGYFTVPQLYKRVGILLSETDPVEREKHCIPLSGFCRSVEGRLPMDAKVFLPGMLGEDNVGKLGNYYFMTYYLFPRTVDISAGLPVVCGDHWQGRDPESVEELHARGYDLVVEFGDEGRISATELNRLGEKGQYSSTASYRIYDPAVAFVLPVLVALFGVAVIKKGFGSLYKRMGVWEKFASGLAVGTLSATQCILAARLIGLRIERMLFLSLIIWAGVLILTTAKQGKAGIFNDLRGIQHPGYLVLFPVVILFPSLFLLAGLEGLQEFDAVAAWAFKAKILYLSQGRTLIDYFSDPRFGYAHLDYPMLVPGLHAFTYGALGHINEFVTKFWAVWMLFAMTMAVFSLSGFPRCKQGLAMIAGVFAVVFMPLTIRYALMEGATIPMVFFAVLGSLQVSVALAEEDDERLMCGLLVLFAAAMTKFEGMLLVGIWIVALLVTRNGRKLMKPSRSLRVAASICCVSVMPYLFLRMNIPSLHPQSKWITEALHNTRRAVHNFPREATAVLTGQFVSDELAGWSSPDGEHLVWEGQWTGPGCLLDKATPGFAWICALFTALALWGFRKTRSLILIFTVIPFAFLLAVCAAISCVPRSIETLENAIVFSADCMAGRYLFPVFAAWLICLLAHLVHKHRKQPESDCDVASSDTGISRLNT